MTRIKKLLAAGFTVALVSAGAAVVSAPVGAVTEYNPSAATPDGDTDSLRDVLQNQVVDDDVVNLEAGATYTLDDCEEGQIEIEADVTINGNGATIEQTCEDRVLDVKQSVTINATTIMGGDRGGDGGGIYVDADEDDGSLLLQGSTVTRNRATGNGGGVYAGGPTTIIESSIVNNAVGGDGAGLSNDAPLWVVRSTVAENCAEDDGGALDGDDDAWFVNSTVTGNTFDDQGAIGQDDGVLTLVYSTIVSNTLEDGVDCDVSSEMDADVEPSDTNEASNVSFGEGGSMRVFGTVIALPIDVNEGSAGAFNCATDEVTTSSGYNYSDDDTCGLTDPTDKEDAADPMLGALGGNGGPTQTRLPQTGSPLINAIPTAACSGGDALAESTITTDQRLLVRPDIVNQRCDIGAVEVQTQAVEIEPTFTG